MIRAMLSGVLIFGLAVTFYPRELRNFSLRLRSNAHSAVISTIHVVRDLVITPDDPPRAASRR
jgi:hypothetical protein